MEDHIFSGSESVPMLVSKEYLAEKLNALINIELSEINTKLLKSEVNKEKDEVDSDDDEDEVDIEGEERLITEGLSRLLKKHPKSHTIIETMLSYLNSVDLDDPDLGIYIRQCFEVITHKPHKSIDDFLDTSSTTNNRITTPKEIDHPVIQEVENYLKQELISLTPKLANKKQTFTRSLLMSLYSSVTSILNANNKEGYFDEQFFDFLNQFFLKYDEYDIAYYQHEIISYILEIIKYQIYFMASLNQIENECEFTLLEIRQRRRNLDLLEKQAIRRKKEYLDVLYENRISFLESYELLENDKVFYTNDISPSSSIDDDDDDDDDSSEDDDDNNNNDQSDSSNDNEFIYPKPPKTTPSLKRMNPKDNIERSPVPPLVAIKYPATVCSIEECCHLGKEKDEDDTGLRIRAERLILGYKHNNQTVVNFFEKLKIVNLIEEIIQDGTDPVDVVMEIIKDPSTANYYKKEYSISN